MNFGTDDSSSLKSRLVNILKAYQWSFVGYLILAALIPKFYELSMLEQCKNCQEDIIYGIDVTHDILLIYFTHDPRKKKSPLPLVLNLSKPQDVAEMAFRLNVDQCSSYFIDKL